MTNAPDVIVIGGGLAGLGVAVELASRGTSVVVLEKDDIGFEQSGRSTAGINPFPPDHQPGDAAPTLAELSAREWSTFEDRFGSIQLNRQGLVKVVIDDDDQAFMDSNPPRPGLTVELLNRDEARERFPTLDGPFQSVSVRPGGHVDPFLTLRRLHEAGQREGVEHRIGDMVIGFDTAGGNVTSVRLATGESLRCGAIVIAAGLSSPRLCDQLGVHIPSRRIRQTVGVTGPLPIGTLPGIVHAGTFGALQKADGTIRVMGGYRATSMVHDLSFNDFQDFRLWTQGFLAHRHELQVSVDFGLLRNDLARTLRRRPSDAFPLGHAPKVTHRRPVVERLQRLGTLVSSTAGVRIHRWFAGAMDITPDFKPVLGPLETFSNAYVASGYSGFGFSFGPGGSRAVAQIVLGAPDEIRDLDQFRPNRFMRDGVRVNTNSPF